MAANPHYWIMKREEMHFVYAAFYPDREDIYVKFGQSATPYKRVRTVTLNCPFVLAQATFAGAGSKKNADKIESLMRSRLDGYRTRGEWYRFSKEDGKVFSATIKSIFALATGRKLAWTAIDVQEINRDILKFAQTRWANIAKTVQSLSNA